jgi:hypothetical protein
MAIPEQTITGVSGLGANAPGVLRRTAAELNPGPAKFLATADATPVRWLPPIVWVAHFPHRRFWPTFRPEAPAEPRQESVNQRVSKASSFILQKNVRAACS